MCYILNFLCINKHLWVTEDIKIEQDEIDAPAMPWVHVIMSNDQGITSAAILLRILLFHTYVIFCISSHCP